MIRPKIKVNNPYEKNLARWFGFEEGSNEQLEKYIKQPLALAENGLIMKSCKTKILY